MKEFQAILTAFDDWLWGNWLLFVLLGVGILYTVITGGIQIRRFGYIIRKTVWEPIRSKNKESKESGTFFLSGPVYRGGILCGKRQYRGRIHGRAGRRNGSHLLDVGCCLCGHGNQVRGNHPGHAVPGEE